MSAAANKALVVAHLGTTYTQHNPGAPDGAEGFIGYVHWLRGQYPELHLATKRVIAEDDLVVTHSNLHLKPARPAPTAHQEMNRAGSLHFTRPPGSR
jgi:predicted SnoaL-like aldol condensation-catalyzing enzyme